MSAFTGSLLIEEIVPGKLWRLVSPIRYAVGSVDSSLVVTVPSGFVTDGTSIPYFLRVFLAVWGTYGRASAVHDYLYYAIRKNEQNDVLGNGNTASRRKIADEIFLEAMTVLKTGKILRTLLYWSVRIFGWVRTRKPL